MENSDQDFKGNYAHRTYIKDLYLELPNYQHHHSSLNGADDEIFIGRGENSKKIEDTLNSSEKNGNGSYLVTGYRGMGKTSLVNNVIKKYKQNKIKESILIRRINVNFSQTNLNESDILKQLVQHMVYDIERNPLIRFSTIANLKNIYLITAYLIFTLYLLLVPKDLTTRLIELFKELNPSGVISILLIVSYLAFTIVFIKRIVFQLIKVINYFSPPSPSYFLYIKTLVLEKFVRSFSLFAGSMLLFMVLVPVSFKIIETINGATDKNYSPVFITFFILLPVMLSVANLRISAIVKYMFEMVIAEKKIYDKLLDLLERCNTNITSEIGLENSNDNLPLGFVNKKTRSYPIANSKEIENEIIYALKQYSKFVYYKKKYVIVFDELDKIETSLGKTSSSYDDKLINDNTDLTQKEIIELSIRKKIILNILSSLKYFTTEAKARFIFIAGREMFDAALADIADRQSSLSSIFHQIIYLDSFLKDKGSLGQARGLTNLVEEYLRKILLPSDYSRELTLEVEGKQVFLKTSSSFIKKYYNYLAFTRPAKVEENLKIVYTIQNFIIYLTYRSNGSPKKLVKLVEEYIESRDYIAADLFSPQHKRAFVKEKRHTDANALFIRFSYKSQYKFAFISYLYRPFILNNSQFIKQYSDNVLVSTPYLMDHIIKFHPFAFSLQNLELLPEVISNNRNPILRYFIEELIGFLGENHIRETEIGLFEYKFINKTSDEILYLSKVFEAESAAFNFTLNETDLVKNYIQQKIKETHKNFLNSESGDHKNNYPLQFLYNLLGDSYYFDQEFDNSIISYQSGLQLLRHKPYFELEYEQFIMLIRLKLKLGLVYEKMKSYELALATYNDSITHTISYLSVLSKAQEVKPIRSSSSEQESEKIIFNSFHNLLQTVNQTLLSSLYLVEKMNIEGITINDLTRYHFQFLKILAISQRYSGEISKVVANYYSNIGNLLYYKNFTIRNVTRSPIAPKNLMPGDYDSFSKIKALIYFSYKHYEPKEAISDPFVMNPYSKKLNMTSKEPELPMETNEVENWRKDESGYEPKYNKDYRFSFYTFITYKHAFTKLLYGNQSVNSDKNSLIQMFLECSTINYDFQNKYDKIFLKTVALSISNIANQLFSILNTRDNKIEVSDLLVRAVEIWHISPEFTLLEGKTRTLFKGLCEPKGKSENELQVSFVLLKENLLKLEKHWYTRDRFKQDLIETNHLLSSGQCFDSEYHYAPIKNVLDNLHGKLIKGKPKYGILAFWDKFIWEYFVDYSSNPAKTQYNDLELIIILYYLSGRFYSRAGKSMSFGFQLKKILHVIKNTVNIKPFPNRKTQHLDDMQRLQSDQQRNLLSLVEETFLFQILEITSWTSNSTDRPQIYKYKDSQNIETIYHPPHLARFNYSNTSNASAIKEAIYLFADIKINSIDFKGFKSLKECVDDIPELSLMSPYNVVSTQYSRILELDLQEKINRAMLKSFLFSQIFTDDVKSVFLTDNLYKPHEITNVLSFWEDTLFGPYKRYGVVVRERNENNSTRIDDRFEIEGKSLGDLETPIEHALWKIVDRLQSGAPDDLRSFFDYQELIANSIYSLRQIISSIRIQGVNYYISYSYLALFHYKLGNWYKHYALCRSVLRRLKQYYKSESLNKIDEFMASLLGSDGIISLDSTSQYQIALQYYHKSKQLHSNGQEYERTMKNLIYLEDDFNDNLYHFGIALERQRLNSYHIRKRIKKLENELKDSPLYRYESFAAQSPDDVSE